MKSEIFEEVEVIYVLYGSGSGHTLWTRLWLMCLSLCASSLICTVTQAHERRVNPEQQLSSGCRALEAQSGLSHHI